MTDSISPAPPPPAPGYPAPNGYYPPLNGQPGAPVKTNGLAITSLVLGILSVALFGIVFGFIALSQIKKTGAKGRGLAIGGISASFAWLAIGIAAIVLGATVLGGPVTKAESCQQVISQIQKPEVVLKAATSEASSNPAAFEADFQALGTALSTAADKVKDPQVQSAARGSAKAIDEYLVAFKLMQTAPSDSTKTSLQNAAADIHAAGNAFEKVCNYRP